MNEIRNIGNGQFRILPAGRKERAGERSSEPVDAIGIRPETDMDRRRNPERRRRDKSGKAGKIAVERRTSSERRAPRVDIDV